MRCREAREKLNALAGELVSGEEGDALREHLRRCPDCARLAAVERILAGDLEQLREIQPARPLTVEQIRERITIREKHDMNAGWGARIMRHAKDIFYRRPQLGIAAVAVSVILIASVLVPVGTERQVGYEVAFAAPGRNLVLNQENTIRVLAALDLKDANVQASVADSGFEYEIAPLEDSIQVRKLMKVLDSMGAKQVRSKAVVAGTTPRTIWQLLLNDERLKIDSSRSGNLTVKPIRISIDSLGAKFKDDFTLWVSLDDQHGDTLSGLLLYKEGDKTNIELLGLGSGRGSNDCGWNSILNGETVLNTRMPNGEQARFDLTNIGDVRKLEQAGYNFYLMEFGTPGQIPIPGMGPKLNKVDSDNFADTVVIEYMVPRAYNVQLQIFDENRREIRTLVDCIALAGIRNAVWDGRDEEGSRVEPGTYICRFTAGDYVETREFELTR